MWLENNSTIDDAQMNSDLTIKRLGEQYKEELEEVISY